MQTLLFYNHVVKIKPSMRLKITCCISRFERHTALECSNPESCLAVAAISGFLFADVLSLRSPNIIRPHSCIRQNTVSQTTSGQNLSGAIGGNISRIVVVFGRESNLPVVIGAYRDDDDDDVSDIPWLSGLIRLYSDLQHAVLS